MQEVLLVLKEVQAVSCTGGVTGGGAGGADGACGSIGGPPSALPTYFVCS